MRQLQSVTEGHHEKLPAERALVDVTEPWAEAAVSPGLWAEAGLGNPE